MKKIISKIKSRAGFTLSEMLVTLAVMSLFSSAVLVGITTAFAVRRDSIIANDADILASMVADYITNELRTASKIDYKDEDGDGKSEYITYQSNESGFNKAALKLDNGRLIIRIESDGTLTDPSAAEKKYDVFSTAAYSDKSVCELEIKYLEFNSSDNNTVQVIFSIGASGEDGDIVSRDFTVGLLNGTEETTSDPSSP